MHVSASQIALHSRCQRRWYFEKVLRLVEESGDAAALGTWVHKGLDAHYKGEPFEAPPYVLKYVNAALTLTPPNGPQIESEAHIHGTGFMVAGVPFKGFIDLLSHADADHIRIIDLKTRGSFDRNLSPDELARDVQLNIYAKYALDRFDPLDVEVTHAYVQTEPKKHDDEYFIPKTASSSVTVSPAEIEDVFQGVVTPSVEALKVTVGAQSYKDVPFNKGDCYSFNRPCPHISKCFPSAASRLVAGFADESTTMSLADRLTATAPTAASIVPPDAPNPKVVKATPAQAPTTAVFTNTAPGLFLYVDCLPVKGAGSTIMALEDYLAPLAANIAAGLKVTDVREAKFGEGTAALAAAVRKAPPTGVVSASTSGLSGLVVDVLIPFASVVVRGIR